MNKPLALGTILWLLLAAIALLFISRGDPDKYLIDDVTPARSTVCVTAPPVCDAACVRLSTGRKMT